MTAMATLEERHSVTAEMPCAHHQDSHRGGHADGILSFAALGLVVLAVAAVLGWDVFGGRLLVMETPSMCPTVCVGSLVADRPLQGALHVGELITFHPPNTYTETYTHEVSRIFANGAIQTRGVGNATHDPWLITRSDIVGEVVFSIWGLGWVLKALPLLAVGVLAWVLTRPRIARRIRRAWDRGWLIVLTVLPLWTLHPLVGATVISTMSDPSHRSWIRATVVNTGILPASFHAVGDRVVSHVSPTGLVQLAGPATERDYLMLRETASLYWWGWAILALLVLSPLAGYLWHVYRDDEVAPARLPESLR